MEGNDRYRLDSRRFGHAYNVIAIAIECCQELQIEGRDLLDEPHTLLFAERVPALEHVLLPIPPQALTQRVDIRRGQRTEIRSQRRTALISDL